MRQSGKVIFSSKMEIVQINYKDLSEKLKDLTQFVESRSSVCFTSAIVSEKSLNKFKTMDSGSNSKGITGEEISLQDIRKGNFRKLSPNGKK